MGANPENTALNAEQPIHVTLLEAAQFDDAFREQWRDLEQHLETPNPFFCSWFLEPAMRHLAPPEGVRLCVLRRASDGLLVGLVPLVIGNTYAKIPLKHFAVWLHDHCYNGVPLMRRGFAQDIYGALLDWVDTHPEGARFFRFIEHPFTEDAESVIEAACAHHQRSFYIQRYRERAILNGGQDIADILASGFNAKKRKELRRQAKRLEELGDMEMQHLTERDEIIQAAGAFVPLEMAGWKGHREGAIPIGRSEEERVFFEEVMSAGAHIHSVSCDQLCVNGAPAAILFTLRCCGAVSAFKIAHDETLNPYSPGVQLMREATKRMLEDKTMRHFDSCARSGHPVAGSLWRERMSVVQFNIPAGNAVDGFLLRLCAKLERIMDLVLARVGGASQERT